MTTITIEKLCELRKYKAMMSDVSTVVLDGVTFRISRVPDGADGDTFVVWEHGISKLLRGIAYCATLGCASTSPQERRNDAWGIAVRAQYYLTHPKEGRSYEEFVRKQRWLAN